MRLIIHPEASAEIEKESNYYEKQQAGLGAAFLDEVDAAIGSILSMPAAYLERRKNIRLFLFPRFPFSLVYRTNKDTLEVLVVRHQKRHPEFGMERV